MTLPALDCGAPALDLGLRAPRDPAGGALGLFAERHATFTFATRVAIRRACDRLGLKPGDEVLAPGYNCGSEIDPLRDAGLAVRLYPVDRSTVIDPDVVEARIGPRTRAVYVIHYFGFLQPQLAALRALCDRHSLALIEDCALSLLSGERPAEGRTGDVAVFCFYKFFPVILGGALVENRPLAGAVAPLRPAPARVIGRVFAREGLKSLAGPGIQHRVRAIRQRLKGAPTTPGSAARAALPDMPGHYYFDPDLRDRGLSALTRRALANADIGAAIRRRRENYLALLRLVDGLSGVTPLHPDLPAATCPLNLPLLIHARDAVARSLIVEGIAATPWWSGYNRHLAWDDSGDGRYLKDNVLSLSIHPGFGEDHLRHMAQRLQKALRDAG